VRRADPRPPRREPLRRAKTSAPGRGPERPTVRADAARLRSIDRPRSATLRRPRGDLRLCPTDHLLPVALPDFEILPEAAARFVDRRRRLLQGQCQPTQFVGQLVRRGIVARSNPARLLRRVATLGWFCPKLASSIASARRIRHSASARRFLACSNPARLLSRVATIGWPGPKLATSIVNARRISGSASASRFVSRSNWARLLRSLATSGRSGPKLVSSIASARRINGSACACSDFAQSSVPSWFISRAVGSAIPPESAH